jgi:peptidoglycan/LPS O-acetylase OafA/YrhL
MGVSSVIAGAGDRIEVNYGRGKGTSRNSLKPRGGHPTASRTDFYRNNLDCLRLVLSSAVALFHISALTNLSSFSVVGRYLSPHFAVKSFFVISGLLIYRSCSRSPSTAAYFEKRARRIYPAYFVVVVLAAVALAPMSTLSLSQYFFGYGFWKYLGANLVFLNFLAPSLPGVFASNSLSAVNGALWTLKIEVAFYLFVPVLHYLCRRFETKTVIGTVFGLSGMWKYGFELLALKDKSSSITPLDSPRSIYSQLAVQFPAQLVYFCAGILLLLYFERLKPHFLAISCFTTSLFLVDHFFKGEALDLFWIPGVVFVFGFWRYFGDFSTRGDFSYGVYIVHWPIVQLLISLGLVRANPAVFLVVSLSLVALGAWLMWSFVERRFLAATSHYRKASLMHAQKV